MTAGDSDVSVVPGPDVPLGLGATLYIGPYLLGVQVTSIGTDSTNQLAGDLRQLPEHRLVAGALLHLGALVGAMGLVAVVYNLRQTTVQHPRPKEPRRYR